MSSEWQVTVLSQDGVEQGAALWSGCAGGVLPRCHEGGISV